MSRHDEVIHTILRGCIETLARDFSDAVRNLTLDEVALEVGKKIRDPNIANQVIGIIHAMKDD